MSFENDPTLRLDTAAVEQELLKHAVTPSTEELLQQRSSYVKLRGGESLTATAHLPLLDGDEVFQGTGLKLGPLMAIAYPPKIDPVLCFNQIKKGKHRFLAINLSQLMEAEQGGELPAALRSGDRLLAGPTKRFQVPRSPKARISGLETREVLPRFVGNVDFLAGAEVGGFIISDLFTRGGTRVQYNAALLPQIDPFGGAPFPPPYPRS